MSTSTSATICWRIDHHGPWQGKERPSFDLEACMDNDIDSKTFWRLLGMRAIGAAVVAAQGSKGPAGFLALSATHVTANPPTMLVSISRKTSALSAVAESR